MIKIGEERQEPRFEMQTMAGRTVYRHLKYKYTTEKTNQAVTIYGGNPNEPLYQKTLASAEQVLGVRLAWVYIGHYACFDISF